MPKAVAVSPFDFRQFKYSRHRPLSPFHKAAEAGILARKIESGIGCSRFRMRKRFQRADHGSVKLDADHFLVLDGSLFKAIPRMPLGANFKIVTIPQN